MLNKLITYVARVFNKRVEARIEDLKLWLKGAEDRFINYLTNCNKYKYQYFRRGNCKGCRFYAKDEKLLTEGKCYCIFNPRPEIVTPKHKCGRIVKR